MVGRGHTKTFSRSHHKQGVAMTFGRIVEQFGFACDKEAAVKAATNYCRR